LLFLTGASAFGQEPATPLQPATLEEKANALLDELAEARERIAELREGLEGKTGESRRLQLRQIQEEELRGGDFAHDLAELVIEADREGLELGNARAELLALMVDGPAGIQRAIDERIAVMESRQRRRDEASPESAVDLQDAVTAAGRSLDSAYRFYVRHVRLMRKLELDDSEARASLIEQLEKRAAEMAALARASAEETRALNERLALNPGDAVAKTREALLVLRQKAAVEALRRVVDMLDELGVDIAEYRETLFNLTGDVSEIGLDTEVVAELLEYWVTQAREWIRSNGWSILVKIFIVGLILLASWLLARLTRMLVYRGLVRGGARMSRLLQSMMAGVIGNIVLALGVLVALAQLGISIGPMLAGLGIAGFIVGFALQDTLGNFASGVMILVYRPFDEGDIIEAATVTGRVETMNLVSTTILTLDNQTLIVPNGRIWGDVIRNVTHQRNRRVDLVFRIGLDDDVDMAERILKEAVVADERVLDEPTPNIRLHEVSQSSYDFIVRPWVRTRDYWDVYWDLTREVQRRFTAAGLKPPRPQRDVHITGDGGHWVGADGATPL
jgi:small conductance mechanosensitive channel